MIASYNRIGFLWGVPGLIVQVLGFRMARDTGDGVIGLGGILLMIGLGYAAKAKGHSGWYGLFGILSFVGVFMLAALPDRAQHGISPGWAVLTARRVGARPIEPAAKLRKPSEVELEVELEPKPKISIKRDGRVVMTLPAHAAAFAGKLDDAGELVARDARAWEPAYTAEDVAALLGILVNVGVLEVV